MATFDNEANKVSPGCVEIRMERIGQAQGTGGLWWVAEGFADGTSKPRGLFNGRDQAEQLARNLASGAGVPLNSKSYED
jgi:hypothetical protein